jgi:hypothetical protein
MSSSWLNGFASSLRALTSAALEIHPVAHKVSHSINPTTMIMPKARENAFMASSPYIRDTPRGMSSVAANRNKTDKRREYCYIILTNVGAWG